MATKKPVWEDISRHWHGESSEVPRTWELQLEEINLSIVIRRRRHLPDVWVVSCGEIVDDLHLAPGLTAEQAQQEAVRRVLGILNLYITEIVKATE
jgi:hypothetical protein